MQAVVYAGPGRVEVADVPDARVEEPGDAVVRVTHTAICGTDLHAYHGLDGIPPGTVLGHEFVGRVADVGGAVQRLRPGETVVGASFTACGHCWWCRRGDHWHCEQRCFFGYGSVFGKPLGGAQAELVRVPHADAVLTRLPAGCPAEAALFATDVLATGWVAAERGEVAPGDVVAVIGGGAVGQAVSLACQTVGAAHIVVVDLLDDRRRLAAAHGALAADPDTAGPMVADLTGGRGADVVVEAVGGPGPLAAACRLVRRRGTVVSVGAHFDAAFPLPVAEAFASELTLRFAVGDSMRVRDRLLPLLGAGVIDPSVIVTGRLPLAQAPEAYARFARHEEVKVLLTPGADDRSPRVRADFPPPPMRTP